MRYTSTCLSPGKPELTSIELLRNQALLRGLGIIWCQDATTMSREIEQGGIIITSNSIILEKKQSSVTIVFCQFHRRHLLYWMGWHAHCLFSLDLQRAHVLIAAKCRVGHLWVVSKRWHTWQDRLLNVLQPTPMKLIPIEELLLVCQKPLRISSLEINDTVCLGWNRHFSLGQRLKHVNPLGMT